MRIHHVTLTGFGPFRGSESVDFDAFTADGIFLITGRTGAGKTSILDAITYGLFGRIPRYDEVAGAKVRSDHLGPTDLCEVTVEFSAASGRHRVRRSPAYMRPKQRGEGLTPVKASFELSELRDGEWVVTETKEGNADKHVSDVLPLSAEQFRQVILLAQGQFQEFLVAGSDKRREVLSKLFDTSRFTAYSHDLDEQARVLRRNVEKLGAQLGTLAQTLAKQTANEIPEFVEVATGAGLTEWAAACGEDQAKALAEAASAATRAADALTAARSAHDIAADVQRRQRERAGAVQEQAVLTEQQPMIDAQREQLRVARLAALAAQACNEAERTEAVKRDTEPVLARAVAQWAAKVAEQGDEMPPTLERARAVADEAAAELLALDDAVRLDAQLPQLVAARERAGAALDQFEARLVVATEQRSQLTDERSAAEERSADVAVQLDTYTDAPAALAEAEAGLKAAEERETLVTAWAEALASQQRDSEAAAAAQRHRDDVVKRQFAEYAGVLAAALTPGEPCGVCGGTEHPAPAELAADHVDADTVRAANDDVARLQEHAQQAAERVARLATQVEALDAVVAGGDVETWTLQVKEARVRVDDLSALQSESRSLQASLTRITAELTELTARLDAAQDERLRLAGDESAARQSVVDAERRLAEARAEFASVAERRTHLAGRQAVAVQVEGALRALDEAERRHGEAQETLVATLTEHGFADATDARAATMPPDALARVEAAVLAHDARSRAVGDRLASSDLQDLPPEPVDLTTLADALREAAGAHTDAAHALGAAEHQARSVNDVVARIEEALRGSETARAEYEVINSLAATLRGQGQNEKKMALEAFALAAELEEIVAAANLRLTKMTSGRFEFRHSDTEDSKRVASGLGLDVLDAHTGEARSPKSLSGGEKFQASLALALGLAEVVTARAGGLRLDTLFVDEGFGTLDPETLESTMATLDGLREGGRTIGLISHVAAMKETIACQLKVDVTAGGWSTIRQR